MEFNEEQLKLLSVIAPEIDFSDGVSDDAFFALDDKVSDYFALHGLADNNQVNRLGQICEEIMDILAG